MQLSNLKINKKIFFGIGSVIVISTVVSMSYLFMVNAATDQKIVALQESKRPANLQLTVITDDTCKECTKLDTIVAYIKTQNVKMGDNKLISANSAEARAIIKNYKITKLPVLIVNGELNKNSALKQLWPKIGDISQDTFVL